MEKIIEGDSLIKNIAIFWLAGAGLLGVGASYPLLTGENRFFYSFLTAHLAFAIHLWIPAVEIALWRYFIRSTGHNPPGGPITAFGLLAGGLFMAIGAWIGADNPLPLDYAPLFPNTPFVAGLAAVYALWLIHSILVWVAFLSKSKAARKENEIPFAAGFLGAALAAMVTIINLALGAVTLPSGLEPFYAIQIAVYGGGHSIQFVHIPLMITAWGILAGVWEKERPRKALVRLFAVMAGLVFWTPLLYFFADPVTQTHGVPWTMLIGLGLGTVSLVASITVLYAGGWKIPVIVISFACFLVGGWSPGISDRTALSLTAHYHGLLGAATTAYLALFFDRRRKIPSIFFGSGALLIAFSFLLLSPISLPRKTAAIEGLLSAYPAASAGVITGASLAGIAVLWIVLTGGSKRAKERKKI